MDNNLTSSDEALVYHSQGRPGKIEVVPTKPCLTQIDLSLAYSPGVAEPCLEIAKDRSKVFEYTAKGNLVAVITDGSAVLGLGDIGPDAAKPVMEGKAVLFKRFADIDVFDIELGTKMSMRLSPRSRLLLRQSAALTSKIFQRPAVSKSKSVCKKNVTSLFSMMINMALR